MTQANLSTTVDVDPDDSTEYLGETKARRRAVALALTLLCPGLGLMYVGQLLKGVTINLIFLLVLEAFVIVFSILKFFPLLPAMVVVLAWVVFTTFVGAAVADKLPKDGEEYLLRGYNHWTIYAVVYVLTFAAPIGVTAQFVSRYLLGFEGIASAAMYPTLKVGDVALVDKSAFRNHAPQRGDLVTVSAHGTGAGLVLRVVGVADDIIRIEGQTVFVNNEPLEREELAEDALRGPSLDGEGDLLAMVEENHGNRYVISVSPKAYVADSIPPTKLAADELFVLADNRAQVPHGMKGQRDQGARIRDSRDFGTVHRDEVIGRPLYIAWSTGATGVRWDRIGLRTQ